MGEMVIRSRSDIATGDGEIDVQPNSVYLIITHTYIKEVKKFDFERIQEIKYTFDHDIISTPFRYDQTTGIATHPTDSELSFRVK